MASPTQALVHNWRLKLSALGLSIFMWALVQTEPSNQETFSAVPVRVQIVDTGWTTSGAPTPATVELRLGGPAREIIRLAREGTSVRVPITQVGSLDTLITLRRDWVQLGQRSGLTVESVSPATVRVSFERAQTRLVPVFGRYLGSIPDGLALAAGIEVTPRLVRIRGPASRLQGLDSIPLVPFDLADVGSSGPFTVPVDTAGLLGASVVPQTATIDIRVEDVVERVLDGLTVELDIAPGEAEVIAIPSAIQVRLVGARSIVTAIDRARLRVWVPPQLLEGMTPGEDRVVPLRVDGVPALVTAVPGVERVRVRRAIDEPGAPGAWDRP